MPRLPKETRTDRHYIAVFRISSDEMRIAFEKVAMRRSEERYRARGKVFVA